MIAGVGVLAGQAGIVFQLAVLTQILKMQNLFATVAGFAEFFKRRVRQRVGKLRRDTKLTHDRSNKL